MEKLLKKDSTFCWNEECQWSLDVLKEKMFTGSILVFPDWKKEFHVHVDASCIALGAVLRKDNEGELDHQIKFVSRKMSKAKKNYSTTQREGLAMVILDEAHGEAVEGHYARKAIVKNILRVGLWWPTLHEDSKAYCRACNACQRISRPSWRDDLPLNLHVSLRPFEKWAIDFAGQIQPLGKKTGAQHIITETEYLTRWVEAQPMKDCTMATATKFLFEYVLTRFGCQKILMSDRGTHFLNETISALMEEFQVYHQKIMLYHPQANGTVEAFNKILENALTKVCNAQRNDLDVRIPAVLWAYRTTCKKLTGHTTFTPVYGIEAVMPMEYIVPSLRIAPFIGMADRRALEEWLAQLIELEEDRFLDGFNQQVQKECEKAWHNRHIKLCTFKVNDLLLLYDSKFDKFLGKFQMHWLGPYVIKEITDGGAVQLVIFKRDPFPIKVNGNRLKPYTGDLAR
eukprot:PITA_16601